LRSGLPALALALSSRAMTEEIWASLEMFWLKKMTPPTSPCLI
jgi:hypothetical protein